MGDKGTLWLPENASTIGQEIDWLFYFVYWVSILFFVAVIGAMFYFMFKYRRKSNDELPEEVHEPKWLEYGLIIGPTLLVLVIFTWGFQTFLTFNVSPPDAYEIKVTARQWGWAYQYPNGAEVATDLHVPVGRPVKLTMTSEDVLHSMFIPAFRVKYDIQPNRYSSLWFTATRETADDEEGFHLFCTEYCGRSHSGMIGRVIVHNERDFRNWLESVSVDVNNPIEYGTSLYSTLACNTCHSSDGQEGGQYAGPTFLNLYGKQEQLTDGSTVLADENYLLESIVNPGAKIVAGYNNQMPASYGNLSQLQLNALIEYIKSLSENE